MYRWKRIFVLVQKDLKSGLRDNIVLYSILAPLILAVLLKVFLPVLAGNAVNVVVTREDYSFGDRLSAYAQVEYVEDREALRERVLQWDDAVGVTGPRGNKPFVLVTEGNEDDAVIEMVGAAVDKLAGKLEGVPVEAVDLGKSGHPSYQVMAIMLCLTSLLVGGMLTGFSMAGGERAKYQAGPAGDSPY